MLTQPVMKSKLLLEWDGPNVLLKPIANCQKKIKIDAFAISGFNNPERKSEREREMES